MTNTKKFSEFTAGQIDDSTYQTVGLGVGSNVRMPGHFQWTTATRPTSPYDGLEGYNTDLSQYEYWVASSSTWVQIAAGSVGVTEIDTGLGLTGGPITSFGTISFAPIAANSFWANTTGSASVPAVTSLSAFLLSANNLSDLTNKATARSNLGVAIGTNVEAWSSTLDLIAAGTWPGATSISTLGTITTGIWHGSVVTVPFGGTGLTSDTPFSVLCGGTTSTSALQQVAGLGNAGQVLTSQGTGALPVWSNTTGSGTVNSGSINELAYYAANGTAVSGLATGGNGVLVTDAGGVPSISSTLPATVQANITALGTITSGVWHGTTIDVPHGGSGNTTFTAYSLVCAGTTPTGAFQNVSGLGSTGQVLTSQGAGSLPVWSNVSGTGTVNSGLANEIAYYASNGTVISGLATANSGVLITNNSGAPSILVGSGVSGQILQVVAAGSPAWSTPTYPSLSGATGNVLRSDGTNNNYSTFTISDTFTINDLVYASGTNTLSSLISGNNGMLVTSATGVPSISTTFGQGLAMASSVLGVGGANNIPFNDGKGIIDSNNNNLLLFTKTASAVNYLQISNAATAGLPGILATGSDATISLNISVKGQGSVVLGNNGGASNIALFNSTVGTIVNYLGFTASATGVAPAIGPIGTDSNILLQLVGKGTSGVGIQGASTNATPPAGNLGEVVTATVTAASATSISSATDTNITSISLTAGNWLVFGNGGVTFAGVVGSQAQFWISTTSATLPDGSLRSTLSQAASSSVISLTAPTVRLSLAATTPVYLSARCTFATSTATMYGKITAIRI